MQYANGQKMSIKETITNIVPNKSVSMIFEDDFMTMDYTLTISDLDGNSKIKTHTSTVGNSMVSKSIMALMSGSIKKQEETNLVNLKKVIEQNTKVYLQ